MEHNLVTYVEPLINIIFEVMQKKIRLVVSVITSAFICQMMERLNYRHTMCCFIPHETKE